MKLYLSQVRVLFGILYFSIAERSGGCDMWLRNCDFSANDRVVLKKLRGISHLLINVEQMLSVSVV